MKAYEEMFNKAVTDLKQRFKSGALVHARSQPGFSQALFEAEQALDAAWRQPDTGIFREALTRWYILQKKVLEQYRQKLVDR